MPSPSSEPPHCERLPWDSEFFGFPVGRVTVSHLTVESAAKIVQWSEKAGIRTLYFSGDGRCAETLDLAQRNGFKFVDTRVDFALNLDGSVDISGGKGTICAAGIEDLEPLQAMARDAYDDTRFLKDTGFPVARARELYAELIRRDMDVNKVLVAKSTSQAERIAGYITCELDPVAGGGRIGLMAVDEACRGKGIGSALVTAALNLFRESGCHDVKVATQATNVAAQRLYQSFGFRTFEVSISFHRWSSST